MHAAAGHAAAAKLAPAAEPMEPTTVLRGTAHQQQQQGRETAESTPTRATFAGGVQESVGR